MSKGDFGLYFVTFSVLVWVSLYSLLSAATVPTLRLWLMKLWRIVLPVAVLATMVFGGGLVYLLMR